MNADFALVGDASPHSRRQAALLLHAVAPSDREWLLHRLDGESRRAIEVMLAELRQLGVPVSTELVREALGLDAASASASTSTSLSSQASTSASAERSATTRARRPWTGASPVALHGLLTHEPDALVARALRLMDSDARFAVLQRFELPRRRHLAELLTALTEQPRSSPSESLDRALHATLSSRLAARREATTLWPLARVRLAIAARPWRARPHAATTASARVRAAP